MYILLKNYNFKFDILKFERKNQTRLHVAWASCEVSACYKLESV
jgi:hypothetical protein